MSGKGSRGLEKSKRRTFTPGLHFSWTWHIRLLLLRQAVKQLWRCAACSSQQSARGGSGSDEEVVGRRMNYHTVSLKAFSSKRLTPSNVCVRDHMFERQWVGGTRCLDKPCELLGLLGEKAIGLTYRLR